MEPTTHRRLVITVDVRDVITQPYGTDKERWWAREDRVLDIPADADAGALVRAAVDAAAATVRDPS